ncbi:MAG TPA: hypothetical protein EYP90_10540, partial [Chromatiaceae bacterium]|nr:hypothetical protein [Chromatiaceae bacterium]
MRSIKCMSLPGLYLLSLFIICSPAATPLLSATKDDVELAPGRKMAEQATRKRHFWRTTDHSKLKELQQTFLSGNEITSACLTCHTEASDQIKKTLHWTWTDDNSPPGNRMGKAQYSINNFCISTNNMQDKKCDSCHIGWNGKQGEIACLKCHGQTSFDFEEAFDDYHAFYQSDDPEEREMAKEIQASIQEAAQAVGRPTRSNCGSCHFYGGGGNGVKHGDLDSSMIKPNKALDVHMGLDGQNFQCVRCHTTIAHNIAGRIYGTPAAMDRRSLIQDDLAPKIMCESCHGALTRGAMFLELPYSGSYDFVETRYVFPSTHMVAPKDKALSCTQCHRRPDSRLAGLSGFYMPGRDRIKLFDMAGWLLVLGALAGVSLHAL